MEFKCESLNARERLITLVGRNQTDQKRLAKIVSALSESSSESPYPRLHHAEGEIYGSHDLTIPPIGYEKVFIVLNHPLSAWEEVRDMILGK